MTIVLASDHAGYQLKEAIKEHLADLGVATLDKGPFDEQSVDYPDFGAAVAREVAEGGVPMGILCCGSGIGMAMVANRFPGVRAVQCIDTDTARMARKHNNANILTLGGRRTAKHFAFEIVDVFLNTNFDGGRHERRIEKIDKMTRMP